MPRRKLRIDARALLAALTSRDEGLLGTHLDLVEGVLLRLYDPAVVGRDNEQVEERIDAEPDRFAKVPLYTREYRLMTEFVDQVEDDDLARLLDTALSGREAFRRFDAVLGGWPTERARWAAYREDALARWAVAWLRALGLEPDWDRFVPPEEPDDVPALLRVALAGGRLEVADEAAAQALVVRLARELAEIRREPFRARGVRGRSRVVRGSVEIRRDGRTVTVAVLR
jgi:hypothetical protein